MPTDPCLVTVRAGPAHTKGYENFVSNNLKDEVLKEISSNLEESMKDEALQTFLESVKTGCSIKDCIVQVQNQVLPKVPKERNKFFIKFTFDNQLQIEIGVNKFKNGNAQFYHKIGVAPKVPPEIQAKHEERREMLDKRQKAMKELQEVGSFPRRYLKKQVTNDRSAPFVSGKVSLPGGGWSEEAGHDSLPNPTNRQNSRVLTGWRPEEVRGGGDLSNCRPRARALGDLFRPQGNKPSEAQLRCRSVGRQNRRQERLPSTVRERSISPAEVRRGRRRGGLGDCFLSGLKPSQETLRPTGTASPVARRNVRIKTESEERESLANQMMKHITEHHGRQNSVEVDDWDEEKSVEIEEMSDTVSSDDKTETTYNISHPSDEQTAWDEIAEKPFQNDFSHFRQYPIKNMVQGASNYYDEIPNRTSRYSGSTPSSSKHAREGWHGPVLQRTRPVPVRNFGRLEVSPAVSPCARQEQFNRDGWTEIPIQRL